MRNPIDFNSDGKVDADDAKQGWRALMTWGHANLFCAGCIVGVIGHAVGWPLLKALF